MNRLQLRIACHRAMREMGLGRPLELERLRLRLQERCGMTITVRPEPELLGVNAYGYTTKDSAKEQILIGYEEHTTRVHQTLIVLHEYSHLILDHPGHAIDHGYRTGHVGEFTMISPDMVSAVLGGAPTRRRPPLWSRRRIPPRSLYADQREWEAESMATILLGWAVEGHRSGRAVSPDPLEDALGWT